MKITLRYDGIMFRNGVFDIAFCYTEFRSFFGIGQGTNCIDILVRTKNPKKKGFRKVILENREIHIGNKNFYVHYSVFVNMAKHFGNVFWFKVV